MSLSSVFTGLRGGMFMCSLSRLNKRIRHMLFQNLMKQEISFFEENKPGMVLVPSLKNTVSSKARNHRTATCRCWQEKCFLSSTSVELNRLFLTLHSLRQLNQFFLKSGPSPINPILFLTQTMR